MNIGKPINKIVIESVDDSINISVYHSTKRLIKKSVIILIKDSVLIPIIDSIRSTIRKPI
jgi:hypothetical protein